MSNFTIFLRGKIFGIVLRSGHFWIFNVNLQREKIFFIYVGNKQKTNFWAVTQVCFGCYAGKGIYSTDWTWLFLYLTYLWYRIIFRLQWQKISDFFIPGQVSFPIRSEKGWASEWVSECNVLFFVIWPMEKIYVDYTSFLTYVLPFFVSTYVPQSSPTIQSQARRIFYQLE